VVLEGEVLEQSVLEEAVLKGAVLEGGGTRRGGTRRGGTKRGSTRRGGTNLYQQMPAMTRQTMQRRVAADTTPVRYNILSAQCWNTM